MRQDPENDGVINISVACVAVACVVVATPARVVAANPINENLAQPAADLRLKFWLLSQPKHPPIPVSQAPASWNLGRWHEVLTLRSWPAATLALGGRAQRSVAGCDESSNPFVCPTTATITVAPELKLKNKKVAVFAGALLKTATGSLRSAMPTFGMRW